MLRSRPLPSLPLEAYHDEGSKGDCGERRIVAEREIEKRGSRCVGENPCKCLKVLETWAKLAEEGRRRFPESPRGSPFGAGMVEEKNSPAGIGAGTGTGLVFGDRGREYHSPAPNRTDAHP
ncbi:hypothetical protein Droror1_Dr00009608 [Drosera rotundifolia]